MAESRGTARRWRFARVTASMTAVNAVILVTALITGPLVARALGPSGRGDLAAILVPFTLAPLVLHLGLGVYGAREAARGRPLGPLLGTLCTAALVVGLLGAVGGFLLADVLAEGRETVHRYLLVAFALLPFGLVATVLVSVASGLERWPAVLASRLIPPLTSVAALTVLYVADALTVRSAAIVAFAGGVVSALPLLGLLRGHRLSVDLSVLRAGARFGTKAWIGGLANLSNARLDQLLMIPLVSPRQLGLYAVAVSLAGITGALTAGLGPPLFTRVAGGETELAARALRVTMWIVGAVTIAAAAATPFVIGLLFGSAFADAIPMALILLVAGLPLAGATVLTQALTAAGRPGVPALGEALALAVTVAGLVLLLPPLAGIGAAVVSLAAYSVNFGLQLVVATREFAAGVREFLLIRRSDLEWGWKLARGALPRRPLEAHDLS